MSPTPDFSNYRTILLRIASSATSLITDVEINNLLQRGILVSLAEDASPQSLALLAETAVSSPQEDLQSLALQTLIILAERSIPGADQELCRIFLLHNSQDAKNTAITHKFFPRNPNEEAVFRLLTGQISNPPPYFLTAQYALKAPTDVQQRMLAAGRSAGWTEWESIVTTRLQSPEALFKLWPILKQESSMNVVRQILVADSEAGVITARETLCRLFLNYGDDPSSEIIQHLHYLPADLAERAALLFLTGKSDAYQALDFNHDLLTTYYQASSREVKKRILAQTRKSGQSAWLETLTAERQVRWLVELNDQDWDASLRILQTYQKWDDLWRLAQAAPTWWTVQILKILELQSWLPTVEASGFQHLQKMAASCEPDALSIHLSQPIHLSPSEITALAPHPFTDQFTSADAIGSIYEWDAATGKMTARLQPPPGPIWSLAYSPDAALLISGHGDQIIRVWRFEDRRIVKSLEGHRALVKALAVHPDGALLASAGFDQTVRLWRFPYGPEQKTLGSGLGEIFSLAIGKDGQVVASGGTSGTIQIWSLPEGVPIRTVEGHTDIITAIEINATYHIIASASRDQTVRIWNYPLGTPLNTLSGHTAPVTSLALHPDGQWAASGDANGSLRLWRLSGNQSIQSLSTNSSPLTAMMFTSSGRYLAAANKNGAIYVWDMKPLILPRLPLEQISKGDLSWLEAHHADKNIPAQIQHWLEFTLEMTRWNRRFDIQLEETSHIRVGEFDIEL